VTAHEINRAEVVAEIAAVFRHYEHALLEHDIAALNQLFWQSAAVVRYGVAEQSYGIEAIRAYRRSAQPVSAGRGLRNTVIATFGSDFASVCTEFTSDETARPGRQTQTWVRLPEGWRIVAAHVSVVRGEEVNSES
jgi:hypothetical protein